MRTVTQNLGRSIVGGLLAVCWATVAFGQAPPPRDNGPAEMDTVVTAISEGASFTIDGRAVAVGVIRPLVPEAPLALAFDSNVGEPAAIVQISALRLTLVLRAAAVEVLLGDDGRLTIRPVDGFSSSGWVDAYHNDSGASVRFAIGQTTFEIGSVAARLAATSGGFALSVGFGVVTVAGSSGARVSLDAAGSNAIAVASDGGIAAPARADNVAAEMNSARSATVQGSLVPIFARVAEAVAEGDIEPPTRGSRVVAVAVAPEVRVGEIVPRGGTVTAPVGATPAGSAGGVVRSTAETFLRSGTPTLVVIGTRIERTRIVGAAPGGSAALQVSPRLLPSRLQIGRPR